MIRLFSSFDLIIFYFQLYIILILLIGGIFLNFYFLSSIKFLFQNFNLYMKEFIFSLNNSNVSKSLDLFLIFLIVLIFFLNFISIFFYNFAFTSQLRVILFWRLMIWVSFLFFSLIKKSKGQFRHYVPEGSPLILSPFLVVIEIVRRSIRPVTLTVRLVANILAGHLLVILLTLIVQNINYTFLFLRFLNFVEIFVSLIQAYIFITLLTLYYREI